MSFGRMSSSTRHTALRVVLYIFLVLLVSDLGALVDRALHPEIPYFDQEHLVVGGVTAITMIALLVALEAYLARRRGIETQLRESEEWHRTILQTTPGRLLAAGRRGASAGSQ